MNALVKFNAATLTLALRKPAAMAALKTEIEPCGKMWSRLLQTSQFASNDELESAVSAGRAMVTSPQYQELQRYVEESSRNATREEIFSEVARILAEMPGSDGHQRALRISSWTDDIEDAEASALAVTKGCKTARTTKTWNSVADILAAITAAQQELDNLFYSIKDLPKQLDVQEKRLERRKLEESWAPYREAASAFRYRGEVPSEEIEPQVRYIWDHDHGAGAYDRFKADLILQQLKGTGAKFVRQSLATLEAETNAELGPGIFDMLWNGLDKTGTAAEIQERMKTACFIQKLQHGRFLKAPEKVA
jgi:hypothetical protein